MVITMIGVIIMSYLVRWILTVASAKYITRLKMNLKELKERQMKTINWRIWKNKKKH